MNRVIEDKKKILADDIPHFRIVEGGTEILVVGTAHVSRKSVEDVEVAFESFRPDSVCVELCRSRFDTLRDPDRWRKLDLSSVIKEKKLGLLVSSLILSSFQKKIGETTGVQPGEEMLRAVTLAEEGGMEPVLADRDVRTTLRRAWSRIGFFSRLWLASNLFASLLVREEIEPDEIERMKHEDVLTDLFSNLPRRYQRVKEVIIDERDSYLAESIRQAARSLEGNSRRKHRVMAVVGAGHLPGIQAVLETGKEVDLAELSEQPPSKRLQTILTWSVFFGAILFISWLFGGENVRDWENLLIAWVVGRSVGAGLGALIARAHPVTFLVTVVTAPLYFLFIFTGTRLWMYSALTELWFHKPRVSDFENIAHDTESPGDLLKSMYKNRVLKLLWIIFLVSTGLTIGNLVLVPVLIATGVSQWF